MRLRILRRILRTMTHVRHAGRTHFIRPRHIRGRGGNKRRARG